MNRNILEIVNLPENMVELIGRKAFNLSRLKNINVLVPKTLVLTTNFFMEFLTFNEIGCDFQNINPELILSGRFPENLLNELELKLRDMGLENKYLVCRSSSLKEDSESYSFAGQYESIIGIRNFSGLLEAIKICWFKGCSGNAQQYNEYFNLQSSHELALIIQELVVANKSGVLFSFGNKLIIESSWGNGIAIVNNLVTPDKYVIKDGGIINKQINEKSISCLFYEDIKKYDNGDIISFESLTKYNSNVDYKLIHKDPFNCIGYFLLPADISIESSLTNEEVDNIIAVTNVIKKQLNEDNIDVEWTIDAEGELYILQLRPITASLEENEQSDNESVFILKGESASHGIAYGRAKIIKNNSDFDKFEQGDILVCRSTDPNYIPIMSKAAGIISEEGGILSHTAIVAREMGIPCVIKCENVTSRLRDLDNIEVNGTEGSINYCYHKYNNVKNNENYLMSNKSNIIVDAYILWKIYDNFMLEHDSFDLEKYLEFTINLLQRIPKEQISMELDLTDEIMLNQNNALKMISQEQSLLNLFDRIIYLKNNYTNINLNERDYSDFYYYTYIQ
ncbi:Phosphoenolpyruvate synthase [Bacillus cereus]|nr:Phosphoenolpyruvate synthase [Bacillus cereus]